MYRSAALSQYSNIDVETKTQIQDSHQLITLLFEKGCSLLRQSLESLKQEDFEGFSKTTNHAMQIVIGLRGVLDLDKGGDLAKQLYETYTSIAASLFKAIGNKDLVAIEKLYLAMSELKEGWLTVK
jgi:flagellar protein FliS|tara:strand:- start:145 stop:522 length:378 start_codon:yes stop_codon:yes gene_type:complete